MRTDESATAIFYTPSWICKDCGTEYDGAVAWLLVFPNTTNMSIDELLSEEMKEHGVKEPCDGRTSNYWKPEQKTGNGGDNSSKMDTIKIKRNTLGDTRTATYVPTYKEFRDSNRMHIDDVKNMMSALSGEIRSAGIRHDYTKISDERSSLFYRELCATIEGKMNFTEGEWYPMHVRTERHHLNEHCPDNVNLIDVLEMICDCVCAGMARSGEVRPVEISPEILQKAVENTVKLCKEHVEVIEHD